MSSSNSTAQPSVVRHHGKGGNFARNQSNNLVYGTPLPILLPTSPLHPDNPASKVHIAIKAPSSSSGSITQAVAYSPRTAGDPDNPFRAVARPVCTGIYDSHTRSVWVEDASDRKVLFNRGFFGKGSLSRSDPSWATRRAKTLHGERTGQGLTAEEVTALRRRERKQFKVDRAQAILDASLAAEAILAGRLSTTSASRSPGSEPAYLDAEERESAKHLPEASSRPIARTSVVTSTNTAIIPNLDEYAHALPENEGRLTPQTFLVRPTRPDQRVKAPLPASSPASTGPSMSIGKADEATPTGAGRVDTSVSQEDLPEVMDAEHLQLNMEEAIFLAWAIGCLNIVDPRTSQIVPPASALQFMLSAHDAIGPFTSSTPTLIPSDHPLLLSYVAFHHYRSMGWVVKTGIKFCTDWLLYKRGMVFSHAEFAVNVLPHHTTSNAASSKGMSWQWLNTINRVNTQVKKTLIICYVTVPDIVGWSAEDLRNPLQVIGRYRVQELVLRRFVPARMRD